MAVSTQVSPATRPSPVRWTGDDFDAMARAGLLDGKRVELIDGVLLDRGPMNDPHARAIQMGNYVLMGVFPPSRFTVRGQLPLRLGDSRPFPDFAIIDEPPANVATHPTSAALIIEISDATLDFDLDDKAHLYAAHGIPEYWVIDLNARQAHVMRQPRASAAGSQAMYADVRVLKEGEELASLVAPASSIRIAAFLD